MVLIVIGVVVPGTTARLADPPGNPAGAEYGPVIPGPATKNPKISLNEVFTYVRYSSEEKTKLKETTLEMGTKSNSKIAPSVALVILPIPND
jgi:hypothetical protein